MRGCQMCLLCLFFSFPFAPADSYLKAKASLKKHTFAQRIPRVVCIDSTPVSVWEEGRPEAQLTGGLIPECEVKIKISAPTVGKVELLWRSEQTDTQKLLDFSPLKVPLTCKKLLQGCTYIYIFVSFFPSLKLLKNLSAGVGLEDILPCFHSCRGSASAQ